MSAHRVTPASERAGSGQVIVIMGVAGAGKSTVGGALAASLRWRFIDGDNFHTAENISRMRGGIALSDSERAPWLAALRSEIASVLARGESAVVACSALKERYREALVPPAAKSAVSFVHLDADEELLRERLQRREGHFAGGSLLASQLETLEEPTNALRVDAARAPDALVAAIRSAYRL